MVDLPTHIGEFPVMVELGKPFTAGSYTHFTTANSDLERTSVGVGSLKKNKQQSN